MKVKKILIKILLFSLPVVPLTFAQQYEPATKVNATAHIYVEPIRAGEYRYSYKLESKSGSEQDIWVFALEFDGEIYKIRSPNGWDGGFFEGKKVINWSAGGDETPFDPSPSSAVIKDEGK
jgi:hypothetical protein